jgi:glycosyltransferase EpsF
MRRAGSQTLLMNVYRNIDRSKIQFDFAVRAQESEDYCDEILNMGGKIFRFSHIKKKGIICVERELVNIIQENGPYVAVHTHPLYHCGYMLRAANKAGVSKRIVHSHSALSDENILSMLFGWIMRPLIMKYSTDRIAVSKEAALWLDGSNYLCDPKLQFLKNGIDLDAYENLIDDKMYYRNSIGLPKDKIIIGHVGRFAALKNHKFILEIFNSLRYKINNAHLVLIGDGELQLDVKKLIDKKNLNEHVTLLGVRHDIPELFKTMDVFILPSLYEGLAIVLIEAQAAGIPCVVSKSIPLEADMNFGFLEYIGFDENIEVWVNAILSSLEKIIPEWKVRSDNIRKNGFDIEIVVKEWERLYLKD